MYTLTKADIHGVAQPIPLDLRNATRDPEKHDEVNRQGVGVGDAGDPANTLTKEFCHGVAQPMLYENHPNDSRVTGPHEVAPTVVTRFGTGGGNVPLVQQDAHVCYPIAFTTEQTPKFNNDQALTLTKQSPTGGGQPQCVMPPTMAVRRLTPVECERLQGFPDNWSRIPWKGKTEEQCPDGPRYKACGNSMAVPVMRWIGERIKEIDANLPK
jgi:DNA (cytosine-5)-methyltransferase 1